MPFRHLFATLVLMVVLTARCWPQATMQTPPSAISQWEVCELTFNDTTTFANPFWDLIVRAKFTSPAAVDYSVQGFYYDSSAWKVRFAPNTQGTWQFSVTLRSSKDSAAFSGSFICTATQSHGFVRIHPSNPHAFCYSDTTLIIPHGNVGHTPAVTAALLGISLSANGVPAMWDSLQLYGVNTYRIMMFGQDAFQDSFSWKTDEGSANLVYHTLSLDHYNTRVGKLMDRWFQQAKQRNINIYLCMFTLFDIPAYPLNTSPWAASNGGPFATIDDPYNGSTGTGGALLCKYYTYIADRWGAYRNLFAWEYNNEYGVRCTPAYIAMLDSVLRANDPYNHPRSVSFWDNSWSVPSPVNGLSGVNITDDHLYAQNGWTEFDIDSAANSQANYRYAKYPKPVLFGEFGSGQGLYTLSWLVFQRIGYWGAFVGGGYPVLWLSGDNNPSGWDFNQKTLHQLNAVQKVVGRLRQRQTLHPSNGSGLTNLSGSVRSYVMVGDSDVVQYLHHFSSHSTSLSNVNVSITIPGGTPRPWRATFLDPLTGDSLSGLSGTALIGSLTIPVPSFTVDILLHVNLGSVTTEVSGVTAGKPSVWELGQNYPNPFNPTTTIRYALPQRSHLSLTVFNNLGQLVATLVNENQDAGSHVVKFNGSTLASGVYFYRLQAGSFVQTKKLLLLR